MGKEIKRFFMLCSFVIMLGGRLFAESVTFGKDNIRGFTFDNVLHSDSDGDIHFGLYVPKDYDGKEAYALFITLPGYEGLHFQGVGRNIKAEDYGIEAQKYNAKMIVVAPQLSDWRMTSAKQTVALTKYFLEHYNIDQTKVQLFYIALRSGMENWSRSFAQERQSTLSPAETTLITEALRFKKHTSSL